MDPILKEHPKFEECIAVLGYSRVGASGRKVIFSSALGKASASVQPPASHFLPISSVRAIPWLGNNFTFILP